MTAQQKLVELNSIAPKISRNVVWDDAAAQFIRDHGPALAELIEASEDVLTKAYPHRHLAAVLAKLTEPK